MLRKLFSRPPEVSIPEIEVAVADTASRAGHLRLVDVREPAEFASGHPAGRSDVSNVTGGYIAWEKVGLPTETSTGRAA